ncbi:winged helix-turn-helix transcriptional regulator [Microvirga pudoricolor]|uniref:winged helix-turn-helix transcriptional regulator n=1 Tax=Microvirga pudoricolor TaxID=2778729 RepID=UPI00194DAF2E|nr:helix-turn-helix domain-containing protein [Microvirga pudoricolor]MBM6593770.1 helix-turn-helix transcriptional regulator [Microvirga pudoricolor]
MPSPSPASRRKTGGCPTGCSVEDTLSLIDGKWKIVILYKLLRGTLRFNEIRRQIPAVTQRMLTNQLRELEADGLVIRTVYPEVPPRVEYSLSAKGRSLEPVLLALKAWGDANFGAQAQARAA